MNRAGASTARHRYVALLRGVNVGGKKLLPMRELARIFADLGCENVTTFIQSGNVVYGASNRVAKTLAARAGSAIEKQFGFRPPIVVRSGVAMRAILDGNPFVARGVDRNRLHVMFLAGEPSQSAVEALDPKRSPPDVFIARGREIYLDLPNGVARSKLSNAWFDAKLATTSTSRNWATVVQLTALLEG